MLGHNSNMHEVHYCGNAKFFSYLYCDPLFQPTVYDLPKLSLHFPKMGSNDLVNNRVKIMFTSVYRNWGSVINLEIYNPSCAVLLIFNPSTSKAEAVRVISL